MNLKKQLSMFVKDEKVPQAICLVNGEKIAKEFIYDFLKISSKISINDLERAQALFIIQKSIDKKFISTSDFMSGLNEFLFLSSSKNFRRRIIFIPMLDDLSISCQSSLLGRIENCFSHFLFLANSRESGQILPTILSRFVILREGSEDFSKDFESNIDKSLIKIFKSKNYEQLIKELAKDTDFNLNLVFQNIYQVFSQEKLSLKQQFDFLINTYIRIMSLSSKDIAFFELEIEYLSRIHKKNVERFNFIFEMIIKQSFLEKQVDSFEFNS